MLQYSAGSNKPVRNKSGARLTAKRAPMMFGVKDMLNIYSCGRLMFIVSVCMSFSRKLCALIERRAIVDIFRVV